MDVAWAALPHSPASRTFDARSGILPPISLVAPACRATRATAAVPSADTTDGTLGNTGATGSPQLESLARPLLQLVQHLADMESSFVTAIDWEGEHQDVLLSLNTGRIQVPKGNRVDWEDSMCRSMFLAGRTDSADAAAEVPGAGAAVALGMRSFFAVPILLDGTAIGTLCGGSERSIALSAHQAVSVQLIADTLQQLVQADIARSRAETEAARAIDAAIDARAQAQAHAANASHMEQLATTDSLTGRPTAAGSLLAGRMRWRVRGASTTPSACC